MSVNDILIIMFVHVSTFLQFNKHAEDILRYNANAYVYVWIFICVIFVLRPAFSMKAPGQLLFIGIETNQTLWVLANMWLKYGIKQHLKNWIFKNYVFCLWKLNKSLLSRIAFIYVWLTYRYYIYNVNIFLMFFLL